MSTLTNTANICIWLLLLLQVECHPAGANRGGGPEWWRTTLQVPVDALQAHFVFSGDCYGEERWDNNGGGRGWILMLK
jgi:hypothetical protein